MKTSRNLYWMIGVFCLITLGAKIPNFWRDGSESSQPAQLCTPLSIYGVRPGMSRGVVEGRLGPPVDVISANRVIAGKPFVIYRTPHPEAEAPDTINDVRVVYQAGRVVRVDGPHLEKDGEPLLTAKSSQERLETSLGPPPTTRMRLNDSVTCSYPDLGLRVFFASSHIQFFTLTNTLEGAERLTVAGR